MTRPNEAFGQVAKQQDYAVEIDDTDSPYTTSGETHIYVDTSTAAVTVQLATADLAVGKAVNIYDDGNNAATNNITITTEGSANFNPGGVASLTLDTDGAYRQVRGGSTNWFADINANRESVDTAQMAIDGHENITGLETGTVAITDNITNPSDETWGTTKVDTTPVTFATAFDSTPEIYIALNYDAAVLGTVGYENPSTTGFDLSYSKFKVQQRTGKVADWVAIES